MAAEQGAQQACKSTRAIFSLFFCVCLGQNAHGGAVQATLLEGHDAVGQGIQRVIAAHTHVSAGIVTGAALTHDDVAGYTLLTTEDLDTESLGC